MSNPIVVRGLGSLFISTGGYGDGAIYLPETNSQRIPDFVARTKSLFITEFRQERSTPVTNIFVQSVEETGEGSNIIYDYATRAKGLFITQFRRGRNG